MVSCRWPDTQEQHQPHWPYVTWICRPCKPYAAVPHATEVLIQLQVHAQKQYFDIAASKEHVQIQLRPATFTTMQSCALTLRRQQATASGNTHQICKCNLDRQVTNVARAIDKHTCATPCSPKGHQQATASKENNTAICRIRQPRIQPMSHHGMIQRSHTLEYRHHSSPGAADH